MRQVRIDLLVNILIFPNFDYLAWIWFGVHKRVYTVMGSSCNFHETLLQLCWPGTVRVLCRWLFGYMCERGIIQSTGHCLSCELSNTFFETNKSSTESESFQSEKHRLEWRLIDLRGIYFISHRKGGAEFYYATRKIENKRARRSLLICVYIFYMFFLIYRQVLQCFIIIQN